MANLGFQLIYSAFNRIPGVFCDRVFLPDKAYSELFTRHGEALCALRTMKQFSDFDVVAFSMNYENDIPEFIRMLHYGRIPVLTRDRKPGHPLVIAGGVVPTINPEPIADFVDVVCLGEGEELVGQLCRSLLRMLPVRENRREIKAVLSEIPGIYVPEYYSPEYAPDGTVKKYCYTGPGSAPVLRRRVIASLDEYPGASVISTPLMEFPDLHLVEVSRGCPHHCRFCLIPQCYNPYRVRSMASVVSEAMKADTDKRIGLLGAGAADHPELTLICKTLVEKGYRFSFSSLHATGFSEGFIEILESSTPRTLTFAPEAGTDARRRKLGKQFSNERIIASIRLLKNTSVRSIKLYFMIGLPGESAEDVAAIADLCAKLSHEMKTTFRSGGFIPNLIASVSSFVPKAQSDFERAGMNTESELKRKFRILERRFKSIPNTKLFHDTPKWAVVQGLIARGDRRIGRMLFSVALGELSWRSVFRTSPVNPGFFLYRKRPFSERLPWDHLK